MTLQAFVRFALAEYADQVRAGEAGIGSVALVRECVRLARDEISREGGLADQADDDARNLVQALSQELDAGYWSQLASWSPEEATCLAMGSDPDSAALIGFSDAITFRRFEDLRRVAERYMESDEDHAPTALYRHMKRFGAESPRALWKALKKNERYRTRFERKYRNVKHASQKMAAHRDTYLKIIYAIAVEKFGYSENGRTSAVRNIKGAVERSGSKLTEKPIGAILQRACARHKSLTSN